MDIFGTGKKPRISREIINFRLQEVLNENLKPKYFLILLESVRAWINSHHRYVGCIAVSIHLVNKLN